MFCIAFVVSCVLAFVILCVQSISKLLGLSKTAVNIPTHLSKREVSLSVCELVEFGTSENNVNPTGVHGSTRFVV